MPQELYTRLRGRFVALARELAKFGTVGLAGMVVDLGLFNLLLYGVGGPLADHPLPVRAVAICAATVVTYLGNRFWTWKHTGRRRIHREYALFFALNAVGMVINLAVLGLATEVLGLTGPFWANLASIAGIGFGTLFRFWSYRRFVFRHHAADAAARRPAPERGSPAEQVPTVQERSSSDERSDAAVRT